MPSVSQILKMSPEEFLASVEASGKGKKDLPFNSDEEFEIQVSRFRDFRQSDEDLKAMLKAAEKFD